MCTLLVLNRFPFNSKPCTPVLMLYKLARKYLLYSLKERKKERNKQTNKQRRKKKNERTNERTKRTKQNG